MSAKASSKLMKLYVWSRCPFCHKAEIAALERGIPYERVEVPLDMPDWYKKINPGETVPTLELEDGKYVFESNLIAQYFDNVASPAGTLMGATPYERHRIEFFMSQVGDLVGASFGLLRDPWNAEARKYMDDNVAYIDNIVSENQVNGGPYYLDDRFSMADIAIMPFLVRFHTILPYYCAYDVFAKGPHLKKLWAAARQRPSIAKTSLTPNGYVEAFDHVLTEDFFLRKANCGPILYGNEYCPFVDRARLACAAKGFKPHYIEIDLSNKPAWYNIINPRETVPTLVTKDGEYVHESQLIAQYIDHAVEGGPTLVPRGDAEKEYAVSYFTTVAGYFVGAHYGLQNEPTSTQAKEELVWAIKEVQKVLEKKPFGEGPFFGGATLNAGDMALLPFVLRLKVNTPDRTNGYDAFAEFPFLEAYLKAGLESEPGKAVFKTVEQYRALIRK